MLQEKAHEHSLYIYLSKLKDEYKSTEGVTSQVTWLILFAKEEEGGREAGNLR